MDAWSCGQSSVSLGAYTPRFSAAGMVRMKNHEKSGWVHLIWNPGQVLAAGCGETPGRARTFISDQSKEVSQERERRRKRYRCIQTAIDSARRDWRLFFQTFQLSFVISWPISTNEPSLESLKSQQSDGAIIVPVSPRERTIAPFLRRLLTLSAQFPRIRTSSGQFNLYRGETAVLRDKVRDTDSDYVLSIATNSPPYKSEKLAKSCTFVATSAEQAELFRVVREGHPIPESTCWTSPIVIQPVEKRPLWSNGKKHVFLWKLAPAQEKDWAKRYPKVSPF